MTLNSLLEEIHKLVIDGVDISVAQWVNYAAQLNILLMTLETELIEAEMVVNRKIAESLADGKLSAARAKVLSTATTEYEAYLKLKAKKERAEETIKIAKKRVAIEAWQQ